MDGIGWYGLYFTQNCVSLCSLIFWQLSQHIPTGFMFLDDLSVMSIWQKPANQRAEKSEDQSCLEHSG